MSDFLHHTSQLISRLSLFQGHYEIPRAYFELLHQSLILTGLSQNDGGDGKKFMLTIPKQHTYYALSFNIGARRVLGLGFQKERPVLLFLYKEKYIKSEQAMKDLGLFRWQDNKNDTELFATFDPALLLPGGELRFGWMRSTIDQMEENKAVKVIYGRHRPVIFLAAESLEFRKLLFSEAGLGL
jgi:hypothetical protein